MLDGAILRNGESGWRIWLANLAGESGWRIWLANLAGESGWRIWLAHAVRWRYKLEDA